MIIYYFTAEKEETAQISAPVRRETDDEILER